ncbi:MAG: molybdopterin-dependent oxidoreductase [Bacteroidota bacterium]
MTEEGRSGFRTRRGFIGLAAAGVVGSALPGCTYLGSFLPPAIGHLPEAKRQTTFLTPNDDFYLVAIDPDFRPELTLATVEERWSLELVGLNGEARHLGYDDLNARARHIIPYTFECIGNPVGGQLIGTAEWRVVPLRDILADAPGGIEGAQTVLFEALDGFYSSVTLDRATDDYAFLALDMNGVPLPLGHGFPARVILPDLYGKKQPRWLHRVTLLEDASPTSYWERRFWKGSQPPRTTARFDLVDSATAEAPLSLTGMAFAGADGVHAVEVSLDDGATWVRCDLVTPTQPHVWSLWSYTWPRPTQGRHRLAVRAIDSQGRVQTGRRRSRFPSGASGWHRVSVEVTP